jgi:hypothetical protein
LLFVEPRGHVTREQFAAEMQCCQAAGFREEATPTLGRKQLAALFCPPATA